MNLARGPRAGGDGRRALEGAVQGPPLGIAAAQLGGGRGLVVDVALACALALALAVFGWTGFIGSDDPAYARAALGWIEQFPFCGQTHWALRHPVVLPVAGSFLLLGVSELTLILPTLLYLLAASALTCALLRPIAGRSLAVLSALLFASVPIVATGSTIASPDVAELFFCIVSLALFLRAARSPAPWRPLLLAGVAAALAFETRETTLALLVLYALLFLLGFGPPRAQQPWMAVGFLSVISLELGYLWWASGDALHRFHLDLTHDTIVRPRGQGLSAEGNLIVHPLLDPLLVLLVNHEFGLLFYCAVPAAVWAWRTRALGERGRRLARLLVLLAGVWALLVGALPELLRLLPRYYYPAAWGAAVLVALWIGRGLLPRSRALALSVAGLLLLSNLFCIYLDNRSFFFPERALVRLSQQSGEPLHTDPLTSQRADFLLELAGTRRRVLAAAPPPGGLLFAVPRNAQSGVAGRARFDPADWLPGADWERVWSLQEGRKLSGVLLERLGLDTRLPASLWTKLDRPNAPVHAWRRPEGARGGQESPPTVEPAGGPIR